MTAKITAETLSPFIHNSIPVITTELLAQLYGADVNNIQQNHKRNVDRFIEGKHFFKASGEELKDLRLTMSQLQISTKTRSLILWTERGAARHAKMLETDQAWEVFEKLEDCYFSQRGSIQSTSVKPTPATRFLVTLSNTGITDIQPISADVVVAEANCILNELRERGWIVIKRDLLAEKLAAW